MTPGSVATALALALFLAVARVPAAIAVQTPHLATADNLDEPDNYGFCIDLKGAPARCRRRRRGWGLKDVRATPRAPPPAHSAFCAASTSARS